MNELEERTMGVAAGVLLLAGILRFLIAPSTPPPPPGDTSVAGALLGESRRMAEEEERRSRPLAPGERLDVNSVDDVELSRVDGIGPALARRIVQDREARGAFPSMEAMERVPGIGPVTLGRIRGQLRVEPTPGGRAGVDPAGGTAASGSAVGSLARTVDVNRATAAELEALPGIGPALALRIIRIREGVGRFAAPEELLAVPGIGEATLARIRDQLHFGP
jgi:competence protein ComEA